MYQVDYRLITKKNDTADLLPYCDRFGHLAVNLYNASLYRIRQIFTGWDKDVRTPNEQEVFDEVTILQDTYNVSIRRCISYVHLEKLMRVTANPDFFAGLPMQTAQAVVKSAVQDFKNWLAALKAYRKDPAGFTGRPYMPGYKKKGSVCTFAITNQDAVLYPAYEGGIRLKLPLKAERLDISNVSPDAKLKQVQLKPLYDSWALLMTLEIPDVPLRDDMPYKAGIDFGTDNIAAMAVNSSFGLICKGGAIKANNQWFYKRMAYLDSILDRNGTPHMMTAQKRQLSMYHARFNRDQCHKISRYIVDACIREKAGIIVLGTNKGWKQNSNIGRSNNQMFVGMPITMLREMITYKAAMAGIRVIEQEESYTSKADFLSGDHIPVYGRDDDVAVFSGRRLKRGLYRSGTGTVVNADLNGACNILRKAIPDAFADTKDYGFLADPEVIGFKKLDKCIPVEGISGRHGEPSAKEKAA